MYKTPQEILIAAKAHLSDPSNWNRDGGYFKNDNFEGKCCCAFGAIALAVADFKPRSPDAETSYTRSTDQVLIYTLFDWQNTRDVAGWNDEEATHDELMELFDRAIAEATP